MCCKAPLANRLQRPAMKLMVALGIRNLSPLGHLDPHGDGCFVCGYGSRCEDCVYALSKRGTITLVQYAAYLAASAYPVARRGVRRSRVSFDSDYSCEDGASSLFFEVSCSLSTTESKGTTNHYDGKFFVYNGQFRDKTAFFSKPRPEKHLAIQRCHLALDLSARHRCWKLAESRREGRPCCC